MVSRRYLAPLLLFVASCGGASATGDSVLRGIGRIPGASVIIGSPAVDVGSLRLPDLQGPLLGERAIGNRVIIIGDSILAGSAARYGNEMCDELTPLGWRSVVEAEAGQPAAFGREVLVKRIYEGWDAAVVLLGSNPSRNIEQYRTDMTRIVESLAPRPTLLLTTTLFRDSQKAVNDVIREVAAAHGNVSLMDWGTASLQQGVLNADGIHPTPVGRTFLVRSVAAALGRAPSGTGGCIGALFTDDSMGREVMPSTTVTQPPTVVGGSTTTSVALVQGSTTVAEPVATSSTVLPATTTTRP